MRYSDQFLADADPESLRNIIKQATQDIDALQQSVLRLERLSGIAKEIGELDFRAVDTDGNLRVVMSAVDLFNELGVHAHLVGLDAAGVIQFYLSADDGKILFGGGDGWLDQFGLTFTNQEGFIQFLDTLGNGSMFIYADGGDSLILENSFGGTGIAMLIDNAAHTQVIEHSFEATLTEFNVGLDDVDFRYKGTTDGNLLMMDAGLDAAAFGGTAESGYKLKVHGALNVTGGIFVNGLPAAAAVTNANDIFKCNSAGASTFAGTIATLPGGANLTYTPTSGNENVLVPNSTSQLAKMRLYNTTRGTHALISNCNTGTNTITLTANVPAGWATTDVITIASSAVSGGGVNWIDLEITSGEFDDKTFVFLYLLLQDTGGAGQVLLAHPYEAFAVSKYIFVTTQSTQFIGMVTPYKLTSNMISIAWTASGAATATPLIREAGYVL